MLAMTLCLGLSILTVAMAGGGYAAASSNGPAAAEPAREGAIVAFGDSLSEGFGVPRAEAYPARLERKLQSNGYRFRVLNAGISGETSREALARVHRIIALRPDVVVFEIGANDGFMGIRPELIERHISETVGILQAHRIPVILAGMQLPVGHGAAYDKAFRELYPRVAEKHGLILIPFFLEGVAGRPELNLPDGIHPTAEGYRIITEKVYPYVVKALDSLGK